MSATRTPAEDLAPRTGQILTIEELLFRAEALGRMHLDPDFKLFWQNVVLRFIVYDPRYLVYIALDANGMIQPIVYPQQHAPMNA